MSRKKISNKAREFIRWAQKDTCLLCSFPLVLCCHFHHVISVKDFGTNDVFNLIGLCPNHHNMIENLKKTDSSSCYNKINKKYYYKLNAARLIFEHFDNNLEQLVNLLLAPYPGPEEDMSGIFHSQETYINIGYARFMIKRNIEIFKHVNSLRPRIYFGQPLLSEIITEFDPYDITFLNKKEYQKIVDLIVDKNKNLFEEDIFDKATEKQFINLGLPYYQEKFIFSDNFQYSIQELRDMSEDNFMSIGS